MRSNDLQIDCVHSEIVPNVPITGGCFTDMRGSAIACTGFDYNSIFYYKQTKKNDRKDKGKKWSLIGQFMITEAIAL